MPTFEPSYTEAKRETDGDEGGELLHITEIKNQSNTGGERLKLQEINGFIGYPSSLISVETNRGQYSKLECGSMSKIIKSDLWIR